MPHTFSSQTDLKQIDVFYKNWENFRWTKENFEEYQEWASLRKQTVLLKWLKKLTPGAMLDLGCGSAILTSRAKDFVPRVFGLDISLPLLQAVREKKGVSNLVAARAEKLPFASRSFDLILCSEVLEHLLKPERVLKEMQRVLKNHGFALVTTPHLHCYDGLEGATGAVSWCLKLFNTVRRKLGLNPLYPHGHNTHLQKKSPSQWKSLFAGYFVVLVVEPIFIFPYVPEAFPSLKKAQDAFLKRTFHWQARLEERIKQFYPFRYLGQLQLYLLRNI